MIVFFSLISCGSVCMRVIVRLMCIQMLCINFVCVHALVLADFYACMQFCSYVSLKLLVCFRWCMRKLLPLCISYVCARVCGGEYIKKKENH